MLMQRMGRRRREMTAGSRNWSIISTVKESILGV
jgi:hypothetical protein